MIQIQGTLNIKTIGGRNGDFNVGTLTTDIGEFSVKSAELDQYDQGSYDGTFGIGHIGLGYFNWGEGRHVTELKATLSFIAINGIDDLPDNYSSIGEPDPDDLDAKSSVKSDSAKGVGDKGLDRSTKDDSGSSADSEKTAAESDELFSSAILDLIDQGKPVQLDPTVGRPTFPRQIAALKDKGYKYDGNTRIWNKVNSNNAES